jgi:enoyl-CoA hydratase
MSLKVERAGRVVTVTLNRPEALNALNTQTPADLLEILGPLDRDPNIGCFMIIGSGRAFAAGADIKEMAGLTYRDVVSADLFAGWEAFTSLRTPKVAVMNGLVLGGGCELAMMCDVVIAADSATFGQPEIALSMIPGMGGTQRLTRLIGRAKALDLILTGRTLTAGEAERCGLVSRVVPAEELMTVATAVAERIAGFSKPAVTAAREAVDRALESGRSEGLLFERRSGHGLVATTDQSEGMAAFLEKRFPRFSHA